MVIWIVSTILVMMNNAAMDIDVGVFVFISLDKKISQEWVVGSYGNSMLNFLRNFQTVFQDDCTMSHPTSFSTSSSLTPDTVLSIIAVPVGVASIALWFSFAFP